MHSMKFAALAVFGATLWGCATAPETTPPPPEAQSPPAAAARAAEPVTRESLRSAFARIAADRAALDKLIGTRYPSLTGRKRELMADQAAAMFAHPAFADRTYDLIAPELQGRAGMPVGARVAFEGQIRDRAAALGMQLTLKGMLRLGAEDHERFLRFAIGLHRSVDAATCRALIDGQLPPGRMQEVELGYMASRSDAEFEQTIAMNRRAMLAELSDAPAVPQLTVPQAEAARKAWGRAILARSKVPAHKARFERYQSDPDKASDGDACWAALQYLEAMLDLRGEVRTWQLRAYMQDAAQDS